MSGFSDASIKFLKKDMRRWCKEERQMMEGLLLRLAAAEKVIVESRRSWVKTEHRMKAYIETVESLSAYEAWLLSKGGAGK